MIIDMPDTRTRDIAQKIDELHEERGESATSRVLTLLIDTDDTQLEAALTVANGASREHPCRVIAIVPGRADGPRDSGHDSNLDAQVRFGADAGAGEIIILRPRGGLIDHPDTLVIPLLVPDTPIVTWWPTNPPEHPARHPLGAMARSRITDAMRSDDPESTMRRLHDHWSPADVDLSWTRLTVWRAMLAAMLDQPPHLPVTAVQVSGPAGFLPSELLCIWLRMRLGVPVDYVVEPDAEAVTGVHFTREDGTVSLERPHEDHTVISVPGQAPQPISVPVRTLEDCLSEELRRIDPDKVYADVITDGWKLAHA